MTQKEILRGNKLIGIFLGMKYINDAPEDFPNGYYIPTNSDDTDIPLLVEDWYFHSSWDWLKPVIDKIANLYEEGIQQPNGTIYTFTIFAHIDSTWLSVIDFIKWYNTQKK